MGYNYRYGMPDFHASATDISGGAPVVNNSALVGSPNPTTPQNNGSLMGSMTQGFMQGGTLKSGLDAGKGYLEQQGLDAAGRAIQPAAASVGNAVGGAASSAGSAIAQGVKSGVAALAALL